MKQIIITVIAILALYSCKAQTIVPLSNIPESNPGSTYFKDIDNAFNKFEGTWKWENGNTSLTIVLQKVEMVQTFTNDYYDLLVGEYKYIENGIIQNNSLPFTLNTNDPVSHNIQGEEITNKHAPPCSECEPDTRFVKLNLKEIENSQIWGEITMGHFVENGTEKIKVRIYNTGEGIDVGHVDYTGPTQLKIPENSIYTLVKQ